MGQLQGMRSYLNLLKRLIHNSRPGTNSFATIAFTTRSDGIKKLWLLLTILFFAIPTYSSADTVSMSSVDQVLGALAEVVKDRAKSVATRAILDNLTAELCEGKAIDIKISNHKDGDLPGAQTSQEKRTLYLGGSEKCRKEQGDKCNSDDLFVKTCRLIKTEPNIQLTDPYFLKTLSSDTLGFSIRLSTYKLDDVGFKNLNLGPFTKFVHSTMEQMVKGKTDLVSFSRNVDELVDSYSLNGEISLSIVQEISDHQATKDLLEEINKIIVDKTITIDFNGISVNKQIEIWDYNNSSKSLAKSTREFIELFDKKGPFSEARYIPCSLAYPGNANKVNNCHLAMLAFGLRPALAKFECGEPKCKQTVLVHYI